MDAWVYFDIDLIFIKRVYRLFETYCYLSSKSNIKACYIACLYTGLESRKKHTDFSQAKLRYQI